MQQNYIFPSAETEAGVRLHHDKNVVVFDLYVETPQPQFSVIGDRLAADKVELKPVPWTTKNLPGPVHEQNIRLIAMSVSRHAAVLEICALMGTAAADGLDFTRRKTRQQKGASPHRKRLHGVACNFADAADTMPGHCAGASRPYSAAPFFQKIFSFRSSGNERGIETSGSSKSK